MTDINTPFPALYILMRTDMESMNAGKAMAQASHASNAFVHASNVIMPLDSLYKTWTTETPQGFGTAIVLGVTGKELTDILEMATSFGLTNDAVVDPSYPVRDGIVTHFINIVTCGYVFGDKNNPALEYLLGGLSLHP